MSRRTWLMLVGMGVMIVWLALAKGVMDSAAAPLPQDAPPDPNLSISDETCLSCHGQPGLTYPLGDGSEWDLYVPQEAYAASIHGKQGYACVQCHRTVGNYPHPPFEAADLRDAQLQLNTACQYCHSTQYELANDSVHARALANGTRAAAICVDCHTAHDVRQLNDPQTHALLPDTRVWIPQTCARCHSEIYAKYKDSVHGSALIEGNPDVPTCIDCHGVHNIEDPTTTQFRLTSPQMCGKCHTDPTVVGKYGLSTDVLDTYVADFHGTTVTLFEKQHPEELTNKPVCYDCHGIHDISSSDDPIKGLQVRQNLLARCRECHPNATENFPDSWLSHYIPSVEKYPAVFYVNLFYKFFIPGVLGGMGLLVAMDFTRASYNRLRKRQKAPEPAAEPAAVPAADPVAEPAADPVAEPAAVAAEQKEPELLAEAEATHLAEANPSENEPPAEADKLLESDEKPAEGELPANPADFEQDETDKSQL